TIVGGVGMAKLRLSVNIIVKNMEETIRACIDSVRPVADEIIIVDTGSTDQTKEILKDLKINYYEFKWKENFSEVRNFALDHSKGDWILVIDADEILMSDREKLNELMD